MADLNFTIYPDNESASLSLFLKAMQRIQSLINHVDYAVTRERSSRRWVISHLHSSAPMVAVRPLLGDTQTIDIIGKGLHLVTGGADNPPDYFTEDVLEDLKRMRALFAGKDKARRILVSSENMPTVTIQKDIADQAQRILLGGNESLSSIEGRLEAINLHNTSTFTIWDRLSGSPVRCHFAKSPELLDRIKGLLEKRVSVRGRVRFFFNGIPRTVRDIESIDGVASSSDESSSFFGCIPDTNAARDPVAFLRAARGLNGEA